MVICSIIVVSQLVRLSEVLVAFGLSLENVFLPFLYIIVPFLSLTIPIAFLFAVVLTFARLSADGEYPAMLAAGFPLKHSARPVFAVALVLYVVAALCAVNLEAWGRREMVQFLYKKTKTELDNMVKYKMQSGVFLDDFLGYVLYAEKISADRSAFENVMLAPGLGKRTEFTVLAPSGHITGSVETGDLKMTFESGVVYSRRPDTDKISILKFNRAEIDLLKIFHKQILGAESAEDDYRSYRPTQLREYIDVLRKDDTPKNKALLRRVEFLFHQRISSPFAVVSFAFFGMVLGVSDPRRGKSAAYVGAIITIILGYVLVMGFRTFAESGQLPILVAAWLPNIMLIAVGGFLFYQKDRLPPSEGTLTRANLPFFGRNLKK